MDYYYEHDSFIEKVCSKCANIMCNAVMQYCTVVR